MFVTINVKQISHLSGLLLGEVKKGLAIKARSLGRDSFGAIKGELKASRH